MTLVIKIKNWYKNFTDKDGENKLSVFQSPIFLVGLSIKIIASFFFASTYLTKLFIPFVNYYVISGFKNPYDYFYSIGVFNAFPYPEVMLWVLTIPRFAFSFLLTGGINDASMMHLFVYRLPLLLADIVVLVILCRWLKHKTGKVLLYYWCSPIVFYIIYFHLYYFDRDRIQ